MSLTDVTTFDPVTAAETAVPSTEPGKASKSQTRTAAADEGVRAAASARAGVARVAQVVARRGIRIAAVIPLYNGAVYIEEALRSVFDQTLQPDEIIVVDDGSTDGGDKIVERIAQSHPVELVRKANGGQSSARNMGIAHSRATHIALLDQDDVWYRNHLEELVKPFLKRRHQPLGWVYSNLDEIDRRGQLLSRGVIDRVNSGHPKLELTACLSQDLFVLPSSCMIDRQAFERVGGFDERLSGYEDDDLFLRLFRTGAENVYLSQPLASWRQYAGSSSYTRRMARSRIVYLRKLIEEYPDEPELDRYYIRDCLIPRFFPTIAWEYRRTLRMGTNADLRQCVQDLAFVCRMHRKWYVRAGRFGVLPLLRHRFLGRVLMPVMKWLRARRPGMFR